MRQRDKREPAKYLPTELNIKEACERIRATWSPRELESRLACRKVAWSVPTLAPGVEDSALSDSTS